MKIRNGFVSNSSSSSFVFVYDDFLSKVPDELTGDMTLEIEGRDYNSLFLHVTEGTKLYLKEHPSFLEQIEGVYTGFRELKDGASIEESMIGKNIEIQSFGHDEPSSYVVDSPEEAFEQYE